MKTPKSTASARVMHGPVMHGDVVAQKESAEEGGCAGLDPGRAEDHRVPHGTLIPHSVSSVKLSEKAGEARQPGTSESSAGWSNDSEII